MIQDIRYALRMLLKSPTFTAVAVIALGLGIGANTAIFTVVNAVLLRPLPYHDPDRLVRIRETKLPQLPSFSVASGNFLDWHDQNTVFDAICAFRTRGYNLTGRDVPELIRAASVSADLFQTLGVAPARGRDFRPEEDEPGADGVVIVSYGSWQRRFGGAPDLVGQSLTLDGRNYVVVGIMPPEFEFPGPDSGPGYELWTPMAFTAKDRANHSSHSIGAVARLKSGVTMDRALTELRTIARRLEAEYPQTNTGWSVRTEVLLDSIVGDIRPSLLLLLGAVGLVLLVACANVANMLLARAAGRAREIAIRTALGAGRRRIVRQLLTESVLLGVAGGTVGVLLAFWCVRLLAVLAPSLPRMGDVRVDGATLAFTGALSLVTGLVFGAAPAVHVAGASVALSLKDSGTRSSAGIGRQHLRRILVVSEIALALVLLVGASLLLRSFWKLQQVDPGFRTENVLMATVNLPRTKYADLTQATAFFRQLVQNMSALPGVEAVGGATALPFTTDLVMGLTIEGRPPVAVEADLPPTNYYAVTDDYFRAMGIPLVHGRLFTERDREGAPRVALINETLARRFFPGEDPIGRRISVTNGPETFREIVGIVGDVRHYSLDRDAPSQVYEPFVQAPILSMSVVVRTKTDPASLSAAMRSQIATLDRDQPISNVGTLEARVSRWMALRRAPMQMLALFAGVALLLAAVGVYGVMAYSVAQRTREMGIRIALGARTSDVLRLVVREGMTLVVAGTAIGLGASVAVTRSMRSLLFGVGTTDPATFLVVPLLLCAVALVASFLPALRATTVDPLVALRSE